jgi:protein ImuA
MIPLKIFFSQWSSPSFRGSRLAALRRLIRSLEHGPGAALDQAKPLAFGDPAIDAPLGGGLMRGVLHELATKAPLATAPLGCVLALIARTTGPLVLVLHEPAATEDGAPYGPGLSAFGVAPERLIIARVRRPEQVLWAMEQALRLSALAAVIGEIRGATRAVDLVATRRLALAAGKSGVPAFLVRAGAAPGAIAAATRWIITPAPSRDPLGLGPARLEARLVRNRFGPPGAWLLEWSPHAYRFHAEPLPEPLAALPRDRPAAPRSIRRAG